MCLGCGSALSFGVHRRCLYICARFDRIWCWIINHFFVDRYPSPAPVSSPSSTALVGLSVWGGYHSLYHLTPDGDRALQQRPADSLGRSKSNGMRVYLFRSTVGLPGQFKLKKYRLPVRYFFFGIFFGIDREIIVSSSCFSRQGESIQGCSETKNHLLVVPVRAPPGACEGYVT